MFCTILFMLATLNLYSADITIYHEASGIKSEEIEEILIKGINSSIKSNKEKKVYIANGGSFITSYINFGETSIDDNNFPCANIIVNENEYGEYEINVDVYRSSTDYKFFYFLYYVKELSDSEKANLFEKICDGIVTNLKNENKEIVKTEAKLIDQFSVSNYFTDERIESNNPRRGMTVLDDGSMIVRSGKELFLYNSFWKRNVNLTALIPESAFNSKDLWCPVNLSKNEFALMNPSYPAKFIFDNNGTLKRKEKVLLPAGKYMAYFFSDSGKINFLDTGKDYFSSSIIVSGNDSDPVVERNFIRGSFNSVNPGNKEETWIQRMEVVCVYDNNGKLSKIIFPVDNGQKKVNGFLSIIDDENSFYYLDYLTPELEKYDLNGNKLWKVKLPEVCKTLLLYKRKNGVLYFYGNGNVVRICEPGSKLTGELKELCELNTKLTDVNNRKSNAVCYKKMAEIYYRNGGVSAASQSLRNYLEFSPADSSAREKLLNCELILAKENAKIHSEKAFALYDEFGEETASDEYKAAVKLLEKYRKYYPSDIELQKMYSELKTVFGQNAGSVSVPALEVKTVELGVLFPALMNVYACEPSGVLTVKNNSNVTVKNVEVKSFVRKYMDFESPSDVVKEIKPGAEVKIPVRTVLNPEVMNVDENINVQMQISIMWQEGDFQKKQVITRPVTIFKKSAMVWKDTSMLSCFILPNEKSVTDFAFKAIQKTDKKVLTRNVSNAVLIFNSAGTLPVKYIPDPSTPVTEQLGNEFAVDTVRLPFETLKLKGGDCDDLTTLICSLFESAGISTGLITTEGHIFVAFDTGLSYGEFWNNLPDEFAVLNVDGKAWIPLEVTIVAKGFISAWKSACQTLLKEDFEFVSVADSMCRYQSVSVESSGEKFSGGNADKDLFDTENFNSLKIMFEEASSLSESKCKNANELNGIARIYFELNDVDKAISCLNKAYNIDSKNKAVVLNLAGLYNKAGDTKNFQKFAKIAEALPDKITENGNKASSINRASDRNEISLNENSIQKNNGVSIKGKSGVVKRTRPVSGGVAASSVTQKSVITASSRADEKNNFKWNE